MRKLVFALVLVFTASLFAAQVPGGFIDTLVVDQQLIILVD
jgi:hypothetical protein